MEDVNRPKSVLVENKKTDKDKLVGGAVGEIRQLYQNVVPMFRNLI